MASGFSIQGVLDRSIFHRQIGKHAFEPGVLSFQLAQPLRTGNLHAGELALLEVRRGVADAMFTAKLGDRQAGLTCLQHSNDLAIGKFAFLQGNL
nr:hypothetical protein [Achromobacter xylosoxidans]